MECREVVDRLSAFLDDELDPVVSREITEHLASCPSCSAAFARQKQLSEDLRTKLEYHHAPDLVRARIQRDARVSLRSTQRAPAPVAMPWRWLSAAAALVMLVGVAWVTVMRTGERENATIAREVVADHIRSLMADHLADVASTDQHTVKPWFNGKLDFSPPVTDFSAAGYPLIGGRLDYLAGRTVAALVYQRRKHVINVFVWPVTDGRDMISPTSTLQGFHFIRATHAGMAFDVVSDLGAKELEGFARMVAGPTP